MPRTYDFRADVYRGGAKVTELTAITAPTIDADAGSPIKTSMAGEFLYNPDVDYQTDDIKLLQIIDGRETPCGVFCVGTIRDIYTESGAHHIELEGYDRSYRLASTRTETILHLAAGTNYIRAVTTLLVDAGIGLYMETPTDKTLLTDREDWDVGTDYLTIVNQLLGEISYNELYFDPNGYAMLTPAREPDAADIRHTYAAGEVEPVLKPGAEAETDIFDKPNVFIVICSNPELPEPLTAVSVNENPLSSISTLRRGRRVAQVYYVDNIATQDDLDLYASRLRVDSMLSTEIVTVRTINLPEHQLNDVIALEHPSVRGIYQAVGYHMELAAGGEMEHKLRRLILI